MNMFNTLRPRQICRHFIDSISKCIFLNENIQICLRFYWSLFLRFELKNSSIGSVNGLVPTRHQAIIWTNGCLVYWCLYICLTRPQWVHKYDKLVHDIKQFILLLKYALCHIILFWLTVLTTSCCWPELNQCLMIRSLQPQISKRTMGIPMLIRYVYIETAPRIFMEKVSQYVYRWLSARLQ